jgi:hypothetical protein
MCTPQPRAQLLLEACRHSVPATRQRSDHDPVTGVELRHKSPRHMAQPPRHAVALNGRSHRLCHYQPDSRAAVGQLVASLRVHHEVASHGPHAVLDRRPELRRPGHPVPCRKHRRTRADSGSQHPPALAPTIGYDRAPGASTHSKPKSVHPRSSAVIRLEGPLALGHGSNLLVRLAPRRLAHRPTTHAEVDVVAVGKLFVSLANRRGPRGTIPADRCRIADFRATVRGY